MKALIIVDIQNDFCPGGTLAVSDGDVVVAPVNVLIASFERAGSPVFLTRDWHPENHCSFSAHGGIWPAHCITGSDGAAFHPRLNVPNTAVIISKADKKDRDAYSGFEGTNLDSELKALGVTGLIVAGLATDYCIKNTVLDALKLGYETSVAEDGIRAVNIEPDDGKKAVREMKEAGAVFKPAAELI